MSNPTPASDDLSTRLAVDEQVRLAAQQMDDTQKSQPEWLWYSEERTSFGRWKKSPSQAPYVRADLLPSPNEPSRRETVAVTEEMVVALKRELMERFTKQYFGTAAVRAALEAAALSVTGGAEGEAAKLATFAEEAALYFERRDTGGEDAAFWSNVANAENCRKIARLLRASPPTAGEDADGWRPLDEPLRGIGTNSTPEMRARIRELANPNRDDFDRAVIAALDDLEIAERGMRWWRDQRDVQNARANALEATLAAAPSPPSPTASKGG